MRLEHSSEIHLRRRGRQVEGQVREVALGAVLAPPPHPVPAGAHLRAPGFGF